MTVLTSKWHYLWKNGKINLHMNLKKINLYLISKIGLTLNLYIMTKKELVNAIASDAGLSIKDAGKALNAFVGAFGTSMKKGERIQLPGMGTFKVDQRSARVVRNPRTGAKLNVPAKKVVKFKAAPALNKGL
jgi:DNA-binding protein HU-beta